jgi:hypothetical protein
LPPSAVSAKTPGAIFAAISIGFGPAAEDHAIIARSAAAKKNARLTAIRGAKKALLDDRFIGSAAGR